MSVIAIVNRKGGAGKSTLATHIAGYLAASGHEVMLGDVDKQQSSRYWLSLRNERQALIHGWTIDERNFARPPAGVKHVVLDTPGGFQGLGLMKVAMYADAILMPATSSVFDRQSAADCLKELRTLPRVVTGKCRIACVGMRIDARTKNAEALAAWANEMSIPFLGAIRAATAYTRCQEQGRALSDFPADKVADHLKDWQLVTEWVDRILAADQVQAERAPPRPTSRVVASIVPHSVRAAQG